MEYFAQPNILTQFCPTEIFLFNFARNMAMPFHIIMAMSCDMAMSHGHVTWPVTWPCHVTWPWVLAAAFQVYVDRAL